MAVSVAGSDTVVRPVQFSKAPVATVVTVKVDGTTRSAYFTVWGNVSAPAVATSMAGASPVPT